MKVGGGCEISTIIDTIPELVEIGPESFLADGIYLGGPRIHRGAVYLASTALERNTFIGNHTVISCGQRLPEDVLLGICTVADKAFIRSGTSWFGLPPFELPRREVVECDRRLTHDPPLIRYVNRLLWEGMRFVIPVAPMAILLLWLSVMATFERTVPSPALLLILLPLSTFGAALCLCLLTLLSMLRRYSS
jgi:non-ribosomal peptide synthetase-like protein